jgi:hypothetical protein
MSAGPLSSVRLRRPATRAQVTSVVLLDAAGFAVAAAVAAVGAATGMSHGWWAAAFFVLVGCLALLTLTLGQLALVARRAAAGPSPGVVLGQIAGWNVACILVPAGVLAGAPGLVVAGTIVLLVAIAAFLATAPRSDRPGLPDLLYVLYALALAASAGIGTVLAFG